MSARIAWLPAICLIVFAFAPALAAEEISVELDPGKTEVAFVLSDVLHTVHGTFRLKQGHVSFDPDSNAMNGEIVVDAASGNSGSSARDKRMTRDVLEAQRFPEIRFAPAGSVGSIAPSGVSDVQVTGSFLIHGQAHNITIPMHVQMSQDQVTATGKFLVPYVEWGMKNPSNFLLKVNDKVEIELNAVGEVERGSATPQKIRTPRPIYRLSNGPALTDTWRYHRLRPPLSTNSNKSYPQLMTTSASTWQFNGTLPFHTTGFCTRTTFKTSVH